MLTRDKCQATPLLLYLKPLMLFPRYISFSMKSNKLSLQPHELLSLIPPTMFYLEWTAGVGGRGKGEKTLARRGCWKAKHSLINCTEMSKSPIKMSKINNGGTVYYYYYKSEMSEWRSNDTFGLWLSLTAPIRNSFRGRTEISKITTTSGRRNLHSLPPPLSLFLTVDRPLGTNFSLSPAFRSH